MLRNYKHNKNPGFSVIEVIIVITFIGLLSGLTYFSIGKVSQRSYEMAAISKAHTLNSAKISYKVSTKNASDGFNLRTNEEKYELLREFMPMSASSLKLFGTKGYSYSLGNLDEKTIIHKDGKQIEY